MKPQETTRKFFPTSLLNLRAIIVGVAVFNVIWSWEFMNVPNPSMRFMTPLILVSAFGLLLDKSWSNLLAAFLAGYFVIQFVIWFVLEVSTFKHVRLFSAEHLGLIANMDKVFQLSFLLATIILCRAASSILRHAHSRTL